MLLGLDEWIHKCPGSRHGNRSGIVIKNPGAVLYQDRNAVDACLLRQGHDQLHDGNRRYLGPALVKKQPLVKIQGEHPVLRQERLFKQLGPMA